MENRSSEKCSIRVDRIPDDVLGLPEGSGTLGMTLAPGVKDWNWDRDIRTDVRCPRGRWTSPNASPDRRLRALGDRRFERKE